MSRKLIDSGVAWIGKIPEGWRRIKFGYAIQRMSTGLNPRDNFQLTQDDDLFYVTIRNFKDGKLYLDDKCDRITKVAWSQIQERSDLRVGDILFASISDTPQAYLIERDVSNWNINESVFTIRVKPELFDRSYFYYHLTCEAYYSDLRMDATGSTFLSIKQNKLIRSSLVLPPLAEQQRIAAFLDRECEKIDVLRGKIEKQIEKLDELKKSTITEAVTKGLKRGRKMKPSGDKDIGSIPDQWNVVKLKYCCYIRARLGWKGLKADEYVEDGYPFLSAFNIVDNKIVFKDLNYINQFRYDESPEIKLSLGDILLVKDGAGVGKCGVVRCLPKESTVNGSIAVVSPSRSLNSIYLYYYFISSSFENHFRPILGGMGVPHLFQSDLRELVSPLPPLAEQKEIAEYLDKKCAAIDAAKEKCRVQLEKLAEYKKSLIYEYVTGKKEVA